VISLHFFPAFVYTFAFHCRRKDMAEKEALPKKPSLVYLSFGVKKIKYVCVYMFTFFQTKSVFNNKSSI
jgi:hypothetical protein